MQPQQLQIVLILCKYFINNKDLILLQSIVNGYHITITFSIDKLHLIFFFCLKDITYMFYIGTVLYRMLLLCLHSYLSCLYKYTNKNSFVFRAAYVFLNVHFT